jgi:heme-degrading monooxygenase HmoA
MTTRVIVSAIVTEQDSADFERAYAAVRPQVLTTPGHLGNALYRDAEDPTRYILESEWESEEAFREWEDKPIHRETTAPMHQLWRGVERRIYNLAVGGTVTAGEAQVVGAAQAVGGAR